MMEHNNEQKGKMMVREMVGDSLRKAIEEMNSPKSENTPTLEVGWRAAMNAVWLTEEALLETRELKELYRETEWTQKNISRISREAPANMT